MSSNMHVRLIIRQNVEELVDMFELIYSELSLFILHVHNLARSQEEFNKVAHFKLCLNEMLNVTDRSYTRTVFLGATAVQKERAFFHASMVAQRSDPGLISWIEIQKMIYLYSCRDPKTVNFILQQSFNISTD